MLDLIGKLIGGASRIIDKGKDALSVIHKGISFGRDAKAEYDRFRGMYDSMRRKRDAMPGAAMPARQENMVERPAKRARTAMAM
jgi:hypothetical protein